MFVTSAFDIGTLGWGEGGGGGGGGGGGSAKKWPEEEQAVEREKRQ